MNCDVTDHGNAVVVEVKEERLDAHNSNEFKSQMLSLFEAGSNNMIIHLKGVRFIDSSGLGALVSGFKNATARNGSPKPGGMQTQVTSMFELTRLHRVFEIFAGVSEALASF